jgi:hypothetical protein
MLTCCIRVTSNKRPYNSSNNNNNNNSNVSCFINAWLLPQCGCRRFSSWPPQVFINWELCSTSIVTCKADYTKYAYLVTSRILLQVSIKFDIHKWLSNVTLTLFVDYVGRVSRNCMLKYVYVLCCNTEMWRSGWGAAQQTGRSRDRIPMVSLEFFIDVILPAALWPWVRLSL